MHKREAVREIRARSAADAGLAIRSAGPDSRTFVGQAAVFNKRTAIGNPLTWGFYEQIAPGAFTKTLQEGDARFLVDHDTSMIVSRVSAGDLRLQETDQALDVDSDLDTEVSYIRDLERNVDKRRVTGMSFGFIVTKDDWETIDVETKDGASVEAELRTIREVQLLEVSAVTFPAYEETSAAVRALSRRSDPDPLHRRGDLLKPRPSVSRSQMRAAANAMRELRDGKTLSAADVQTLSDVLAALAAADETFDPYVNAMTQVDMALDEAQASLSELLDVANPDADADDEMNRSSEPAEATRSGQPDGSTGAATANALLRVKASASRWRLPLA